MVSNGSVVIGVAFAQSSFGGGAERAVPAAVSISATVRQKDERRRMVFPLLRDLARPYRGAVRPVNRTLVVRGVIFRRLVIGGTASAWSCWRFAGARRPDQS